ncbi:MAG TPA: CYTH and CHAD domain-containing protein [Candidatus Dormibacteraeota bacterium]
MTTAVNREREVKLAAGPGFTMPALGGINGAEPAEPARLQLNTVYYDTPDLRLARWGFSLRHRNGEGWTLKLPSTDQGTALARDEVTAEGSGSRPPAALLKLVRAYVRRSAVGPVVRLRTARHLVRLLAPSEDVAAEVVDDDVSVITGRRLSGRFRELEVELKTGNEELLDALVERLQEAGAGKPDPTPKLARALGEAAVDRPEIPLPEPKPSAPAGELVRAAIAGSVARLLRNDPGVRLGGDAERVHDARVATRRLRSDLRTFAPLLEAAWTDSLREELKWLGGVLGEVRDLDVMLDRLRARVESLPEADRKGAAPLIRRLTEETAEARQRLLAAMNSDRYLDLLENLVAAAQQPALNSAAGDPGKEALPGLARKPWRKLRREVRQLDQSPADPELHRVRILAKRARYAAEAVAPAAGGKAAKLGSALADLQTVLGEHQDSVTLQGWLRERRPASPAAALARGELVGLERAAAGQARSEWPKAWKAAKRKKLRRWMRRS